MQGGTNSKVVIDMYTALNKEGKGHNLKVYWYTAKDQHTPIDAAKKERNCHSQYPALDRSSRGSHLLIACSQIRLL